MRKIVFVVLFLLAVFTVLNAWGASRQAPEGVQTISAVE